MSLSNILHHSAGTEILSTISSKYLSNWPSFSLSCMFMIALWLITLCKTLLFLIYSPHQQPEEDFFCYCYCFKFLLLSKYNFLRRIFLTCTFDHGIPLLKTFHISSYILGQSMTYFSKWLMVCHDWAPNNFFSFSSPIVPLFLYMLFPYFPFFACQILMHSSRCMSVITFIKKTSWDTLFLPCKVRSSSFLYSRILALISQSYVYKLAKLSY